MSNSARTLARFRRRLRLSPPPQPGQPLRTHHNVVDEQITGNFAAPGWRGLTFEIEAGLLPFLGELLPGLNMILLGKSPKASALFFVVHPFAARSAR